MRSHGSSLKFTYSFSCLITACAATAATAEDIVCDGQHHIFYLFLANDLLFTQGFTLFSSSTKETPLKNISAINLKAAWV